MNAIGSAAPSWLTERLAQLAPKVQVCQSPYECEACNDTGWRGSPRGGVTPCECKLPKYAPGVPLEFQPARLENYRVTNNNQRAVELARKFLQDGGTRDLGLIGGVGTGKSRLAASIANAFLLRAFFIRVARLLDLLSPSTGDEDRVAMQRRVETVPVLVLDDLGAERDRATDFTRRTLLELYESRCDGGLRTIWTTNKTLFELSAMQEDDRLSSRLAGRSDVVLIQGDDQRVTAAERRFDPKLAQLGADQ